MAVSMRPSKPPRPRPLESDPWAFPYAALTTKQGILTLRSAESIRKMLRRLKQDAGKLAEKHTYETFLPLAWSQSIFSFKEGNAKLMYPVVSGGGQQVVYLNFARHIEPLIVKHPLYINMTE